MGECGAKMVGLGGGEVIGIKFLATVRWVKIHDVGVVEIAVHIYRVIGDCVGEGEGEIKEVKFIKPRLEDEGCH